MATLTDDELTINVESGTGDDACVFTGQSAGDNKLFMLSEFRFFVAEVL